MLDEKATITRVKSFLMHDLPKYELLNHRTLTSAALDGMPHTHSNLNTALDSMTGQVQAEYYVDAVSDALDALDPQAKLLIELKYMHNLTWMQVASRVMVSDRHAQNLMNKALVSFAYAYAGIDDLRVMK